MMKRITCLGLAAFLVLVVLYGIAGAVGYEFPGGDGSSGNPWHITNWHDLNGIRDYLGDANSGRHFKLMNNLGEATAGYGDYNVCSGWAPIGTSASQFTGTFDGNNKTIRGLFINRPGEKSVGLFGYIFTGKVKNVRLVDVDITGHAAVGGLVGENMGTVENSSSAGSVTGTGNFVGGLVANNRGTVKKSNVAGNVGGIDQVGGLVGSNSAKVEESYFNGNVLGASKIGGLAGRNTENGTIEDSYASGEIEGTGNTVGGLAGYNIGTINKSYATGDVKGKDGYIGGLVGANTSSGEVTRSYFSGSVEGQLRVGGLVGENYGFISQSYSKGQVEGDNGIGGLAGHNYDRVENSYSTANAKGRCCAGGLIGANNGFVLNSYSVGIVEGLEQHFGGLIGFNLKPDDVLNSFWDTESSGFEISAGGEGKDTSEMKTRSTFTDAGWDFDDIWNINALNDGYPFLRWQRVPAPRRRGPSAAPAPEPEPEYPLPPEGFNALPGVGFLSSLKLGWLPSESPNIEKYKLYASTGAGASASDVSMNEAEGLKFYLLAEVPADVLAYTHTGLSRNVRYYYVVTSVNEEGLESNVSSRILWYVAGSDATGELEAVSWGPERIIDEPEAEDSSSGCFIATVAYGSAMSAEVMFLRNFRDGFLLSNRGGSQLVEAYYAASPMLAEAVSESSFLRKVARLHIAPFTKFAGFVTNMN